MSIATNTSATAVNRNHSSITPSNIAPSLHCCAAAAIDPGRLHPIELKRWRQRVGAECGILADTGLKRRKQQ
jgi:hypothetical protein